tara:strand:+ start:7033 stop:7731 length:699 start_codon:yes stop_codon:yes gene_type:complete
VIPLKILQNEGKYEILDSPNSLREQLKKIELAGRTCYQSFKGEITQESAAKFAKMLIGRGHESVLEHSYITVRFQDVSRGFTHELVRHRLCAFSQESTRYVDQRESAIVLPPDKDPDELVTLDRDVHVQAEVRELFHDALDYYHVLREAGWKKEDARQILPIGLANEIVCSANFREWRHIFKMRTAKPAHWEIRTLMCGLLEELQHVIPGIFDDFELVGLDNRNVPFYTQVV